jgi:hypothetical protein
MNNKEHILTYMTTSLFNYAHGRGALEDFHLHWLIGSNNMLSLPQYNYHYTYIPNQTVYKDGVHDFVLGEFVLYIKVFKMDPRRIIDAIDNDVIDELMADANKGSHTYNYRRIRDGGFSLNHRWVLREYLEDVEHYATQVVKLS